jgi:hypothetical protein
MAAQSNPGAFSGSLTNVGTSGSTNQGTGVSAGQAAAFAGTGLDLASSIYALTQGMKESAASRRSRHIYERAKPEAERLLSGLYYNPAAEGFRIPYSNNEFYKYAPLDSMRNLYSYYLGREYGLPESVAASMGAQAIDPIRVPRPPARGSSAAVREATAINPQALAQAGFNQQQVGTVGTLDRLKNQGQLAAFNLWRAQQLGEIIG